MHIHLIALSYSSFSEREKGSWNGPERYLQAGAEQLLREKGFTVTVEHIHFEQPFEDVFEGSELSNQALARVVQQARARGAFPLVLSGTCDSCLGVLAAIGPRQTGIVWCDAHGDFNTPDTSPSGLFIGMPLAVASGRVYKDLWSHIASDPPVSDSHILLVDVRDLDPLERSRIERAAIPIVRVDALQRPDEHIAVLDQFAARVPDIYLHLDIDILALEEAPGVDFPAPGGPSARELERAIATLGSRFNVQAAMMTAYNPDRDQDDKTLQAGLRLLVKVAQAVRDGQSEQ